MCGAATTTRFAEKKMFETSSNLVLVSPRTAEVWPKINQNVAKLTNVRTNLANSLGGIGLSVEECRMHVFKASAGVTSSVPPPIRCPTPAQPRARLSVLSCRDPGKGPILGAIYPHMVTLVLCATPYCTLL